MTGGGPGRDRGGSKVESWTSAPFEILKRIDGDEDFAPRVLAMAMSAEMGATCLGEGGRREGALAWLLLTPF